ncbi:MAG: hypothetical protein JWM43_4078 [Acidobacteriaceae bacterium]|nr:hypothetical protein [Acidobacteriaceae bacterium]
MRTSGTGLVRRAVLCVGAWTLLFAAVSCSRSGVVKDEALRAQRSTASFPAAGENYFHDMDGGIQLNSDEVKGRNMWLVWTGGDDKFWDLMTKSSVGTLDFLKTVSNHPALKANRDNRWNYLGLVNEPCFDKATGPDPEHFGLWIDKRRKDCPADPFESESNYPGVKIGARGHTVPVGSYYGLASGIVGLRLFPNPDFDEDAAKRWDAERFYKDPDYYNDKNLIRPYRVGMACAFCHVGPNPTHPPSDPEHPEWADLSSNVGAQYFWIDRIFSYQADEKSFPYQLFHTSRPGTLDTSLISTDNINNPRSMNAVYGLSWRLAMAQRWETEKLAGGELNNKQFNDFYKDGPLTKFFKAPDIVSPPHILKDGSDSVGALGALNRVYLNIGLFSEEWITHFRPLVGGKKVTPIEISVADQNSVYWQVTQQQTPLTALFFLKSTAPHKLQDAPGGAAYLTKDQAKLVQGKTVYAERCARCHSSKIPDLPASADPGHCNGKDYLSCWNAYWAYTKTDTFKTAMKQKVLASDFLEENYLSTDLRVPITLLRTNACSALATNAIRGNIWDNFSSETYKDLPSIGSIQIYDVVSGQQVPYQMPAGGRGYMRPPSLISAWSTAPFLQNNSVGPFNPSPSVQARVQVFQSSIEQMLWPEKRDVDTVVGDKAHGRIDRTTARSYLTVPGGYLPDALKPLLGFGHRFFPALFGEGQIQIGPIPKGTPVMLLSNLDLLGEKRDPASVLQRNHQIIEFLKRAHHDLGELPPDATDEQVRQTFSNLVPDMVKLSKCPDYVVNRGHYFGTSQSKDEPGLSDAEKVALIEFIKTF